GGEAVGAQRLVLGGERVALLLVRGETEAAGSADGVSGEAGQPLERALGIEPVAARGVAADRLDGDVVGSGAAAEREAAVAAARATGDLTGVVQADGEAGVRERERRRTAGDAAADDDRVGASLKAPDRDRRRRFVEPVAAQRRASTFASGTK